MKDLNKNYKKYFYFLFMLLFFTSVFTLSGNSKEEAAAASTTPQISYSVTGDKTVGSTITIAVNITNGGEIYGGSLDLIFDSNIIEVTSAKMGTLFEKDLKAPLINDTKTPGKTSVVITLSGANKSLSKTSGSLVFITAKVKKEGTINLKTTNDLSKLDLNGYTSCIKLSDKNGNKLNYTFNNLTFKIITSFDAQIISENIPNYMEPGKTYDVYVKVKNTGSSTWSYNSNIKLIFDTSNNFSISSDNSLSSTDNIKSGDTKTFYTKITAPSYSGSYTLKASMSQLDTCFGSSTSKNISIYIPPVIRSITPNLNSPQIAGEEIKFYTSTSTNSNDNIYQYWINDSSGWKIVRDYDSSPYFNYIFTKGGEYSIRVYAKSKYSSKVADSIKTTTFSITNIPYGVDKINSIKMSSDTTKNVGENITFYTTLSSSSNNTLYQYWLKDNLGWHILRDYNDLSYFNWIPSTAGDYSIRVYVKDKSSKNVADSIKTLNFHIDKPDSSPLIIKAINSNSTSTIEIGDDILLYTSTAGGSSIPLYQYWIKDSSGWHLARDYDSSLYFLWTPSAPGNYSIRVYAKDKTSTKIADSIKTVNFDVKNNNPAPVVIKSITSSCNSPQPTNKNIVFCTNLSSLTSTALYQYWINDSSGWKMIKDYNESQYFSWTPATPGTYSIRVYAKDKSSTKIADSIKTISFIVN